MLHRRTSRCGKAWLLAARASRAVFPENALAIVIVNKLMNLKSWSTDALTNFEVARGNAIGDEFILQQVSGCTAVKDPFFADR